jgi:hypothetical protein
MAGSCDGDRSLTFFQNPSLPQVQQIVGDELHLVSKKIDLPELQGAPEDVSREKCKLAAKEADGPVMASFPLPHVISCPAAQLAPISAPIDLDQRDN